MRWALVVPVKRLAVAKTRLAPLGDRARQELALAFALDPVSAARAASLVADVVAVSDDPRATEALAAEGVRVVPDAPDAGLNPALRHGAEVVAPDLPDVGVGALSADLPALRPEELDRALAAAEAALRAEEHGAAMVADVGGLGTTLLVATSLPAFRPQFGPRSRARHRASGVVEVDLPGIRTVRRDVDTEVDLADARRLGVGPRTAAVLP